MKKLNNFYILYEINIYLTNVLIYSLYLKRLLPRYIDLKYRYSKTVELHVFIHIFFFVNI